MKTIRLKGGKGYERGKNIDTILVRFNCLVTKYKTAGSINKKNLR
ncbi:hypothetical protein SAMN04488128_1021711 [Chitinophaga eiseniae]|uniref:Uncharacterized protein n=1 Tax=Chitinophaga eiseniae TaxID=634771 RepID=A0A1T4S2K0_9BACT|nr:hypothetical protein SAMN04488128_1021711 [Chitinophaga eiseniae]